MAFSKSTLRNSVIFEAVCGAVNIAPIKISGQYKIVVALDGNKYLDDYCSRRVKLYDSGSYLEQIANFLKTHNEVIEKKYLRYGGFQKKFTKSFHMPFYFSQMAYDRNETNYTDVQNKIAQCAIIRKVTNQMFYGYENLTEYKEYEQNPDNGIRPSGDSQPLKFFDFAKYNIDKIIDEIQDQEILNYPLYFEWNQQKLTLNGISIQTGAAKSVSISLRNHSMRDTSIEKLNEDILLAFEQNQIFYPRFLNLEFEFEDDSDDKFSLQNYTGWLAWYSKTYSKDANLMVTTANSGTRIKVRDHDFTGYEYEFIPDTQSSVTLRAYEVVNVAGKLVEINDRVPQIRFSTDKVNVGDKWNLSISKLDTAASVSKPLLGLVGVTEDDIKNSLYQTLLYLCAKINKQFRNQYRADVTTKGSKYCVVTLKIIDENIDQNYNGPDGKFIYELSLPANYNYVDSIEYDDSPHCLKAITEYDICLQGNPNILTEYKQIEIREDDGFLYRYNINKVFKLDGNIILRLNGIPKVKTTADCRIITYNKEVLFECISIPLFRFTTRIWANQQYQREGHIFFGAAKDDGNGEFSQFPFYSPISCQKINNVQLLDRNEEDVLNMSFATPGQTTYITPNLLNLDYRFFVDNGCVTEDNNMYSWFSIDSVPPEYLLDLTVSGPDDNGFDNQNKQLFVHRYTPESEYSSYRTLERIPDTDRNAKNLTRGVLASYIYKLNNDVAETFYLGVRYQLDARWAGYKFVVVLDYQNKEYTKVYNQIGYGIYIYDVNKTIVLRLEKCLIEGYLNDGQILDLSDLYCVDNIFQAGGSGMLWQSVNKYVRNDYRKQFTILNLMEKLNQISAENKFVAKHYYRDGWETKERIVPFNLGVYMVENNFAVWEQESNETYLGVKKFNRYTLQLQRASGMYLPYLVYCDYDFEFQIAPFKQYNRLFSLYDGNFGRFVNDITYNEVNPDIEITGVGYHQEFEGNFVSTLWNYNHDITIEIDYQQVINYYDLLLERVKEENEKSKVGRFSLLNLNFDAETIRKGMSAVNGFSNDWEDSAAHQFTYMLLRDLYKFDGITNENGKRLSYMISMQNQYQLTVESNNSLGSNIGTFKKLIMKFSRR